jgi:spore germination protein GerM
VTSVRAGGAGQVRTVALRVVALALLLLLALVGALTFRVLDRVPDTTVYLVRDDGTAMTLEPVHRRLRPTDPLAAAAATVAALAGGPAADEAARGLGSEVPAATRVRSVGWRDDVLVVDLSAEVVAGGGSASMIGRLAQLTYSLTQPSGVDAVELRVEGTLLEAWGGEGVMTRWPWRRPEGGLPRW